MITKICRKCSKKKKATDFPKGKDANGLYYICKSCVVLRNQTHYRNKDPLNRWIDTQFSDIKGRAKRNHIPFDLIKDDMLHLYTMQKGNCKYCDRLVDLNGTRVDHRKSPSIDRIRPELGYVKNNVVLACVRCNTIKNDASLEELQNITSVLESLTIADQSSLS